MPETTPVPWAGESGDGDSGSGLGSEQLREVCLRLLTARARTRSELLERLRHRGADDALAEQVVDRLVAAGLVDDAEFAHSWVRSRHGYRGLARRALLQELRRKGVDADIAEEALAPVDRDAEQERATQLVRARLDRMGVPDRNASSQDGPQPREDTGRLVRRLVGMLGRKGYDPSLAYRVVLAELDAAAAESGPMP